MTETLFHLYSPLILWTGLGLLLFRFMPQSLPRLLGRALYWIGIPLEILALARRTNFSGNIGLVPAIAVAALFLGLGLSSSLWQGWQWIASQRSRSVDEAVKPDSAQLSSLPASLAPLAVSERSLQGSFILAAMLGNTGFVGLAIAPSLIDNASLNWVIFYGITQNLVGTYGLGVLVASYFGRSAQQNRWWTQLRDILSVPSLWAFVIGSLTQSIELPTAIESGLQASITFVIPSAFLLTGMRLSQVSGWQSFQMALIPSSLKVVVMPGLIGLGTSLLGLRGDPRLALVLMSGMPTAFAGLILAEEYNLDRQLIATSIFLSTAILLLMIPLWLVLFG